ncbi:flagellar FliJ family protein [Candidatus Rhabdochlamydia sp. T3358]|uniref:flagellar FliJ family protein n=1 Tax=Candidatus Rhabdochlamydia sp. T3358 TaxID=2099795 RepID=UPI0010B98934|nr:flagellar FliJ family protein [Candidatus Rhabdochlamydia sp. T3358]VHO04175.1 Flagellar FliJ protein [Candidatus Rhabdochlamydia sp. T3358]
MPRYPLKQLAEIKQKNLETAEINLRDKKRFLEQEQTSLTKKEKERDQVKEHRIDKLQQLRDHMDEGAVPHKVEQMKQYLKLVDEKLAVKQRAVVEQKKKVTLAEEEVDKARRELIECQQDVEKMRLHRKEWDRDMHLIEEQKEGVEMDEIGSAGHERKKTATSRQKNKKKKSQ